jgi:tricorn protease
MRRLTRAGILALLAGTLLILGLHVETGLSPRRGLAAALSPQPKSTVEASGSENPTDRPAGSEGRLMRFPDIRGDRIVFSYGGDLWLVGSTGGVARRITSHPGLELFPKFSPDGKWIAFTGQYDGHFNVFVIPAEGGEPKQLTFNPGGEHIAERMGINNEVINWFPDSRHVLFLSRQDTFNTWFGRLYSASIEGGLPEALPLPKGGLTSFAPDGQRIAYNQIFRNFRTWKRYTGGMAQDISIYNLKTNHLEGQVPHTDYTDTFPMWHGDTVYFDSDRGPEHRMNLYSYAVGSKQVERLTHFTEWDVNWPSLGPNAIVFENGGYLHVFDVKSHQERKLTVFLPGDNQQARSHWVNVSKLITDLDIAPDGKRAVFAARGDVFTVPAKEGSIRSLTATPGIREKYVAWSPDGRWIAYMSDRTGEDELYIKPHDGLGPEQRITFDGKMFRLPPVWSPDSTKLLFADKSLRLFYVDIAQKQPVLIDQGKYADVTDYAWSPDSKWVAYANTLENTYSVIYLYSLADRRITPVTTDFTNSFNPYFDPDGKYLYFMSNRSYNEVLGVYDASFANPVATRVYVVTLRQELPSPFPVLSDETAIKRPEEGVPQIPPAPPTPPKQIPPSPVKAQAKPVEKEKPGSEAPVPFRIDLDGIQERIVALPTPPGSLHQLGAAKDIVYYLSVPVAGLSGPLPNQSPEIHAFNLKDRQDYILISGADHYAISFDGSKLLYSAPAPGTTISPEETEGVGGSARTYGIIDAKTPDVASTSATPVVGASTTPPHHVGDGALKLDSMRVEVDPRAEWRQIFDEVWRQQRDYFFEPSMNGVDWPAMRDKYAQLVPYAGDRYDLTYIMGEMIGELANSHTYVGGGDNPDLRPVEVGLLGADFELDTARGLYRIRKIYHGENWEPSLRSPLTEPGVTAHEGDYLLAVNGRPLRAPASPYQLLGNTVNEAVTLTLNSQPTESGARNVMVRPIPDEFELHELNWIETNRRKVDQATHGRIGYVYLPDMSASGLNEFVRQFFPQIRKEGIIFDVRYNGGGFVDQIIFERLRRTLAGMQAARNFESGTVPDYVFYGAMVCITNHYAASDGDFFSYFFKEFKLGPLIGERTWGGVRGIRGEIPLMDGGYITRPEFALYGLDSKWLIENRGVAPDIVVEQQPDLVVAGHDPQLEKAIEVIRHEIDAHPRHLPRRPPDLPAYPSGPG